MSMACLSSLSEVAGLSVCKGCHRARAADLRSAPRQLERKALRFSNVQLDALGHLVIAVGCHDNLVNTLGQCETSGIDGAEVYLEDRVALLVKDHHICIANCLSCGAVEYAHLNLAIIVGRHRCGVAATREGCSGQGCDKGHEAECLYYRCDLLLYT